MKALFDTNILIDQLRGIEAASKELDRYDEVAVSRIVWIEFLVGAKTPDLETQIRRLLNRFDLLEIDAKIAESAVLLRKTKRIKLPDAIIWATAQVHQCLLVTRNTRDFDPNEPGVRVPYTL